MDRVIAAPAEPKSSWWAKMAIALVVMMGVGKRVEAQYKRASGKAFERPVFKPSTPEDFSDSSTCYIRISGTVFDGDKYPAEGSTVFINNSIKTKTDWAGKYILDVPVDILKASGSIRFYGDKFYNVDSQSFALFDLTKKEITVDGFFPRRQIVADDFTTGMAIQTVTYFPYNYSVHYGDPAVDAELRPRPTPYYITLPSFKFVGRFFSSQSSTQERSDNSCAASPTRAPPV